MPLDSRLCPKGHVNSALTDSGAGNTSPARVARTLVASLFSDGNVSATQFTRVLNLAVRLPWPVQARAWDTPQVPAGG